MRLAAQALGIAILASLPSAMGAAAAEGTFSQATPIEGAALTPLAPGMHALAVAIGPDGNLWFGGNRFDFGTSDSKIGRVTPAMEITEFALPENRPAEPYGIVSGPDGNLWFTEWAENRIGRIATGGETTEFPLPDPDSHPDAIAVGSDGNLWFTESGANRIGRITTAGEITQFPLPDPGGKPSAIAAGPDGNLWFTESGANRIGRIATTGDVTEFSLAGPDEKPGQIVAGPDGNLWFTLTAANRIGRITPQGEVEQFPVPTTTGTEQIVAGPDGNLWFTSRDRLGSISPSGQPQRLSCPNRECHLPLISLAAGPTELWFGTWRSTLGYGGGYAEMLRDANEPGYVGRLVPRAARAAIGPRAGAIVGRRTDLRVSCVDAEGCRGSLKLLRRAPAHVRRNFYETGLVLARRRYRLAAGESRRVPLHLTRTGAQLLAERGTLPAWATAGSRPDVEAIQSIVLRPRSGHRSARPKKS